VVWDVRGLAEKLDAVAVTIGQGPGWHYGNVDLLLRHFWRGTEGADVLDYCVYINIFFIYMAEIISMAT